MKEEGETEDGGKHAATVVVTHFVCSARAEKCVQSGSGNNDEDKSDKWFE